MLDPCAEASCSGREPYHSVGRSCGRRAGVGIVNCQLSIDDVLQATTANVIQDGLSVGRWEGRSGRFDGVHCLDSNSETDSSSLVLRSAGILVACGVVGALRWAVLPVAPRVAIFSSEALHPTVGVNGRHSFLINGVRLDDGGARAYTIGHLKNYPRAAAKMSSRP
jgi:hypothetical protein